MQEKDILEKIRDPSSKQFGFSLLVRHYQKPMYAVVRRMVIDHDDADDVLQEVFLKVWKGIDNFREDARLFTWVYRIASNECLQFLAKKKRRFFLPIHDISSELFAKAEQSAGLSGSEIELKLQKAILKLPDKQRLVFNMRYYDELKFEEIASITGTSVGALKASYHLAAKKIEEYVTAG
ncbi:RNA polymerase sigma factor [Imperialibacter roseus]|uniref:RNA polymerase sigma factor n=1 Tax=Imperialibacter roseus TaxID=1324217 RepID=A0ABZ0IYQ5_9BACT|nr:RNA polymerase sigma factor [Imperialibacter roseus]WOK09085.1 RNA polymerase sigma factor [Imperialibacter roseus]